MKSEKRCLEKINFPEIELPSETPRIGADEYERRLTDIRERMEDERLDFIVIYGDREHSANIQFAAGIDPRFEEIVALIPRSGEVALLLGNEDFGYADTSPFTGFRKELYQTLSLMNQHRDRAVDLRAIFAKHGVKPNSKVGIAGWKYFEEEECQDPAHTFETPSFIVDLLRDIAGFTNVTNAGPIFMHPEAGLRLENSPQQLALFEYNASHLTHAFREMLFGIRPGMTEIEAFGLCRCGVAPYSVHPMFTTGERARTSGLNSPSTKIIDKGDPISIGVGVWGALSARAGYVETSEDALNSRHYREYLDSVVLPYHEMASLWYSHVRIGARGGNVYDAIEQKSRSSSLPLMLNPGHSIHYDEWTNSLFFKGSRHAVKSGMLLQCDLIPVPAGYFGSNVEDTVAIGDEKLRHQLARGYPSMWNRIQERRRFMRETLGYEIGEEVLPFSNICGALAPFFLSPDVVVVRR